MPRRKKNKKNKNRKGRSKKTENDTNKENSTASTSNDVMRTCFDNNSFNKSKPITPSELITPLRTPSPQLETKELFEDEVPSIKATPVNKKRSMNRQARKKSNGSMNVTNLNILFDSNFVYNSPKTDNDINVNKSNISIRKRSNSSIAKLHSPGKEKLLSVSQSTQTNKEVPTSATLDLRLCNEILETPKISKVYLVKSVHSENLYEAPSLNNHWLKNDKTNNKTEWSKKVYNGEVNVNPYLNNKEIKIVNRDGSFGEISFFSPNLFQHKSSSTPIEKLQTNNLVDYLKDSLMKDNVIDCSFNIGKVDVPNNQESPVTSKLDQNISFNKTPQLEKVSNKEGNMRSLKLQTLNISKRKSYRTSPKSSNIILQTRIFNRSENFTYSRVNISRRSSSECTSDALIRPTRIGVCEKVLTKLKRYTKVSHKWSVKVVELCAQLGIQLKNSLSSICNIYTDRSMIKSSPESTCKCKCEEYKQEISNLNNRIEELTDEVKTVKTLIEEHKNNKQNIELLSQELNKVREELTQFTEFRAEVESLREQFKCFKAAPPPPSTPVPPPPPPHPCLPPPPPPPPPPPLIMPANSLKITKKAKGKENSDSKSRPVISLDDILKVKLKKTTDRSSVHTPTTRRNSQPVVSMDMLRQVKLKPASRPSFRPETPDSEASVLLTTSPHSSLCRLLTNDGSMFRLKRLRKVGGYSFDSVHRKTLLGKRDRNGS